MKLVRFAKRAASALAICSFLCFSLAACGDDSQETCSRLDGTDLKKDYPGCVAAGGEVSPAVSGLAGFCTLRFDEWDPQFAQCQSVDGYSYNWDCFCPGNYSGGQVCLLFYPEHACPASTPPDQRPVSMMPVCHCS